MDPMRAWLVMGLWQKLCFLFLFTVTAVTLVRALRLWWSPMRLREGSGRPPPSDDSTALRAWQASKLAGSTRGLAQAALWFTCAGAAFGLHSAGNTLGSGRPILAMRTATHAFAFGAQDEQRGLLEIQLAQGAVGLRIEPHDLNAMSNRFGKRGRQ